MFALTPLAVALQGIGYATLLVSLQGLVAVTVAPPPIELATGSQAAFTPRRRVRRWVPLASAPNPYELLLEANRRDEEELVLLGAL